MLGWDFQCHPFRKGPIITLRMAGGFAYKVSPKPAEDKHKLLDSLTLESQRKPRCRLISRMSSKSKGPWACGKTGYFLCGKQGDVCLQGLPGGWEGSMSARPGLAVNGLLAPPPREADTLSFLCLYFSLEKGQTPVKASTWKAGVGELGPWVSGQPGNTLPKIMKQCISKWVCCPHHSHLKTNPHPQGYYGISECPAATSACSAFLIHYKLFSCNLTVSPPISPIIGSTILILHYHS